MNFRDVKIGNKLLIGFSSSIVISIIIGLTGYFGMKTVQKQQDEVSNVLMPSIYSLLVLSEAQTAINAAENILLIDGVSKELRETAYNRFITAKKRIDNSWAIYEPISKSQEEIRVWNDLRIEWQNWWQNHERFLELHKKHEADTILANYKAMSEFAISTLWVSFSKSEELINKLIEINDQETHESDKLAEEETLNSTILLVIIILTGVFISLFLGFIISKAITRPIAKGVELAEAVAMGDLTINIDINQNDEIGQLANALKHMVEKLKSITSEILIGSENISSASQEISSTAQQMSQGANEQASSLEEVSSSMEQMSSNIEQNTDNSHQTEKIATRASNEIIQGSKAVNETVNSMKTISEKVNIISEIAFQTNILALNAAVEAARAGEHGRGFAVVAAEVRKLAERSQIAAKEIGALTKSSVDIAEQTGKMFIEIVPSIQNTARLVQEISASSIEQNNGANQVNMAIQQLNQVSQQNAAASEELATSAEEMNSQAEQLQEIVAYFKVDNQNNRQQTNSINKHKFKIAHSLKQQSKKQGVNLHLNDKTDSDFEHF